MDSLDRQLSRDFVTISIEKALTEIGSPVSNEVSLRLKEDYNCDFADCLDHPEFLNKILKDLFGNSYQKIVDSIKKNLDGLSSNTQLENFLTVIAK